MQGVGAVKLLVKYVCKTAMLRPKVGNLDVYLFSVSLANQGFVAMLFLLVVEYFACNIARELSTASLDISPHIKYLTNSTFV